MQIQWYNSIIPFNPLPDASDSESTNSQTPASGEFQCIMLPNCKGTNSSKMICNVYRSPSYKEDNFLFEIVQINIKQYLIIQCY